MLIAQVMTWLVIHQWDLQGIWQTIAVWISNTFGSGRVFTGIFYMCVGVCLASYGSKVSVIKTPVMTFLLLVVFVIDVKTTAFTVSAICEMILSALFFECVRRIHIKERKLYLGLRQSSKIMYFTHMIFYFIYSRAADKIEPRGVQPFFVVLICCLIVSVIVIECKKIRRRVWHLI